MKRHVFILFYLFEIFFNSRLIQAQNWEQLTHQAEALSEAGKYLEALPIFEKALQKAENEFGKLHINYVKSCENLALLYQSIERRDSAKILYKEAINILIQVIGKENFDYVIACNNLATIYEEEGLYNEAEWLLKESLQILSKINGKENLDYATLCNNLASIYETQGRYNQAAILYEECLAITSKLKGENNSDYALYSNNLATLYKSQNRFQEAESLFQQTMQIRLNLYGKENTYYAQSCNNLASVYVDLKKYEQAELLLKESIEIYDKLLGKETVPYSSAINNLARLYKIQKRYKEAETLYQEALAIRTKILGKDHYLYAQSCNNLAKLYMVQGRYNEAEPLFKQASQTLTQIIQRNFIGLSEKEKEDFFKKYKGYFESYFSYAIQANKAELSTWLLENNLFTKGLLFFSTQQLRRHLEKSPNPAIKKQYNQWISLRTQIAKAYEMGEQKRKQKNINLKELEIQANELEKKLSVELTNAGISVELTPQMHSWKEIQNKLQPNEALIEITRIRYFDGNIFTDSILYIAIIVKKNVSYPELVILPNGNYLENRAISIYKSSLKRQDEFSYQVFFKPFEKNLNNVKKIYFCNDGVYHYVNLLTLYNPKTQKYLFEEYDIQLVSTARDFIRLNKNSLESTRKAYEIYLFGYPSYSGKKSFNQPQSFESRELVAKEGQFSNEKMTYTDIDIRLYEMIEEVTELPGTKLEIENIRSIAQNANLNPHVYLEEKANEGELKKVHGPYILHIATHGFFLKAYNPLYTEVEYFDNPLFRSGLLLANAEMTIKQNQFSFNEENGIFTAYEAMNLDLIGTDLVVLSACETGLGEVNNGEGVLGLQRALQEAGAKSVIMSLWTIDDFATQEMMTLFYQNLLLKKQDKRIAFMNALNEMKFKYQYPYYWGAFVLIGE